MKKLLVMVLGCSVFLTLPSCKKAKEWVDDTISSNLDAKFPSPKNVVVINFLNASNAELIKADNLSISITGKDEKDINNLYGKQQFKVENGEITLSLSPNRTFTSATPVEFDVEVSAPGYLPSSAHVKITEPNATQRLEIAMVNIATPPSGITIKEKTIALSGGVITGNAGIVKNSVAADTTYYDDGVSSIVLPVGTGFYYYETVSKKVKGTRTIYVPEKQTYVVSDVSSSASGGTTNTSGKVTLQITPAHYITEDYEYIQTDYIKKEYVGDAVKVVSLYCPNTAIDQSYLVSYSASSKSYALLNGQTAMEDEMLFKSAVAPSTQRLTDIYFMGTVGGKEITVTPNASKKWFISTLINPNFVNPITNQLIKEGDEIEAGKDYANNKTLRSVVSKAANGQLRVATTSCWIGFFSKASYTATFASGVSYAGREENIPDLENLSHNGGIYDKDNKYIASANYGYAKFASATPIATPLKAIYTSIYWGKVLKTVEVKSGEIAYPYQPPYAITLNPITEFNFSAKCEKGTITYKPSYWFNSYMASSANGMYFYANVQQGLWKTKGLPIGKVINVGGYYANVVLPNKSVTVNYVNNIFQEIPCQ